MPGWTADQVKELLDGVKADLVHRLDGFPQEFAYRSELAVLDAAIDGIRADHVRREEFDGVRAQVREINGRRMGLLGAMAVILLLVSVMSTVLIASRPNTTDIEKRLTKLEVQNQQMQTRLASIEGLDHFFCQTRQKAGLPAC